MRLTFWLGQPVFFKAVRASAVMKEALQFDFGVNSCVNRRKILEVIYTADRN